MANNIRVVFAAVVKRDAIRFPGDVQRVYRQPYLIERVEVDADASPVLFAPEPIDGFFYNNIDFGGLAAHVREDFKLYRFIVGSASQNETHMAWVDRNGYGYDRKGNGEIAFRKWSIAIAGGDPSVLD